MTARSHGRDHVRVHFTTDSLADQEWFVEGYVCDAVQRLPDTDACEEFVFIQADGAEDVDGGRVIVDVYGDAEAVLDSERETWDDLVDDGPLTGWERPDYDTVGKLTEIYGEEGVVYHERLRYAASAMSRVGFDVLDERPPPVDAFPEVDTDPVGWHRVLHLLSNQQGYEIAEELDAYVENVEMCLRILAQHEGPDAAGERAAAIGERLREACADVEPPGDED